MESTTIKRRKAPRENITGKLRTAIFQEALATCPFCGLQKLGSLQVHHIDGNRADNSPDNLIAVCASCHEQVTKGLISEADVRTKKRMLQCGSHPHAPRQTPLVGAANMYGDNAKMFVAEKISFSQPPKSGPIILPGTIGSDPEKYNYVEYLVKRLTSFREAGKSYGQKRKGKVHNGGTRRILANEFGGLPKDLKLECFDTLVDTLKEKIDDTAQGRNNKAKGWSRYHSFEEHCLKPKRD